MKKLIIALTIVTFTAFITGGVSYSQPREYERQNGNDYTIMSPGYLNLDKQRTESMKESIMPEATFEEQIDQIDADLQSDMGERTADKVKPDLKKKTGAEGTTLSRAGQSVVVSGPLDIPIGTGEDQDYEGDWLQSEVFDDASGNGDVITYVYAGFTDDANDTIQNAIGRASSSDRIIVRGGQRLLWRDNLKQRCKPIWRL